MRVLSSELIVKVDDSCADIEYGVVSLVIHKGEIVEIRTEKKERIDENNKNAINC